MIHMNATKLEQTLSGLRGRFFGIETKQGTKINAQLLKETDKYVTINDTRTKAHRKIAKESIMAVTVGGQTIR
jgi:hypothetical protein